MLNAILPTLLLVASNAAAPAPVQAPPKVDFPAASPSCKFEQRVGTTDVVIEYARPSVKGRKVFGELEPYGKVWRTGANGATKITFSTAVKFGGNDVPAGTYSLFTIPTSGEWTVILNKTADQWGAYSYDAKEDQARVQVKPTMLPELVETLEIGLRDVQDSSAMLSIAWEKTRVGVKIEVDVVAALVPQIEAAMAAPGKKPYLSAAMFYYEHGLDLKKALGWMDAGIKEQPAAFWMIYRKGLILEKMGDKKGAMAAAEESLAHAQKAEGDLRDEYVRLNGALKARLK
jgi:hypothetical protein